LRDVKVALKVKTWRILEDEFKALVATSKLADLMKTKIAF